MVIINTKKINVIFIFIAIVAILLVICISIPALHIGGVFNPPVSEKEMTKLFVEDYSVLCNISNYLIKNGIDELYINLNEYNEEVQIGDRNIMEEIEKLTNKRYLVIEKNDNTIVFMRWSNLNSGRGFVYSINGSIPELQFLTYLKECSEPNWYYYEEDFNKWKSEHE